MFAQTPPRITTNLSLIKDQGLDTRHPTTKQKFKCSPPVFRRSNPRLHPPDIRSQEYPSLPEEIVELERRRHRCMRQRRYDQAERIDKSIRRAKSMLGCIQIKQLVESQKEERRSVSQAHRHQMRFFHSQWNQYFQKLSQRQCLILQSFQQQQKKQIDQSQTKLRRRCHSLSSSSREIEQLRQKQNMLRKTSDFGYLKHVKMMLAEAVLRERSKRAKAIQRFAQIEQERLSVAYSKKYAVLLRRLQEYRGDKERIYLRQQKRLKQKYKNVLQQLRHDHCLQFEKTSKLLNIK